MEEGCFWKKDVFGRRMFLAGAISRCGHFSFGMESPMRTSENLPMDAAKKSASLTNCCTSKQQAENIYAHNCTIV